MHAVGVHEMLILTKGENLVSPFKERSPLSSELILRSYTFPVAQHRVKFTSRMTLFLCVMNNRCHQIRGQLHIFYMLDPNDCLEVFGSLNYAVGNH